MIDRKKIKAFVNDVVRHFHPQRVVLFGSYAHGHPNADSDVDLLVVLPHKSHPAIKAAEIRNRIRAEFPMDLIVLSPRAIRQRLATGDYFITEILQRGRTLYESEARSVYRTRDLRIAPLRTKPKRLHSRPPPPLTDNPL
jgi:predicted nucleotidyltransferase